MELSGESVSSFFLANTFNFRKILRKCMADHYLLSNLFLNEAQNMIYYQTCVNDYKI